MDKNIEKTMQNEFDSFFKKVLQNEARNYFKYNNSRRKHEVSFNDLSLFELDKLSFTPQYNCSEAVFEVFGFVIDVLDLDLVKALKTIPDDKSDIILLYYFLDMNDQEIACRLILLRQTVQYRRSVTLKMLKQIMEDNNNVWN